MNTRRDAFKAKTNGSTNGHHRADASPLMEAFGEPAAWPNGSHGANGHANGRPSAPADDPDTLARDALMHCYNG